MSGEDPRGVERVRAAGEALTVDKWIDRESARYPLVRYLIRTYHDEDASLELVDSLPPGVDADEVAFSETGLGNSWRIAGDSLRFERDIEWGEDVHTAFAVNRAIDAPLEEALTVPQVSLYATDGDLIERIRFHDAAGTTAPGPGAVDSERHLPTPAEEPPGPPTEDSRRVQEKQTVRAELSIPGEGPPNPGADVTGFTKSELRASRWTSRFPGNSEEAGRSGGSRPGTPDRDALGRRVYRALAVGGRTYFVVAAVVTWFLVVLVLAFAFPGFDRFAQVVLVAGSLFAVVYVFAVYGRY